MTLFFVGKPLKERFLKARSSTEAKAFCRCVDGNRNVSVLVYLANDEAYGRLLWDLIKT